MTKEEFILKVQLVVPPEEFTNNVAALTQVWPRFYDILVNLCALGFPLGLGLKIILTKQNVVTDQYPSGGPAGTVNSGVSYHDYRVTNGWFVANSQIEYFAHELHKNQFQINAAYEAGRALGRSFSALSAAHKLAGVRMKLRKQRIPRKKKKAFNKLISKL